MRFLSAVRTVANGGDEQKEAHPIPFSSSADAMKEGVGRNSGGSSSAGTLFPTSVEARKSNTARLHLSSARGPGYSTGSSSFRSPSHLRPQDILLRIPLGALLE